MSGYVDRMQWICKCGHARLLHNHMFSMVPPGQDIPPNRPDTECAANECECVRFTPADFKYETFRSDGVLGGITREVDTAEGVHVTFHVSGTDLSVMKNSHDLKDFDDLSEEALADLNVPEGTEPVTFHWYEGSGFQQV